MKTAFVLGNGISRLQFDLGVLKKHGSIFGCNALYRDFIPDVLTAVDDRMIKEIIDAKIQKKCRFIIEDSQANQEFLLDSKIDSIVTNIPSRMDSGNLALLLAAQEATDVYMIGFDYISSTPFHNNVYAGSMNYKSKEEPHVLKVTEESWYYRALIVLLRHPTVNFYRVNNNDYIPPIQEYNFQNISPTLFDEKFQAYRPDFDINPFTKNANDRRTRRGVSGKVLQTREEKLNGRTN